MEPSTMYQSYFRLQRAPFGITPNPAFFYSGNTRGAILQALLYALVQGEGIIKVTGEVGSGKTMLCRMLAGALPPQVDVIYLFHPSLQPDAVLAAIVAELGLDGGSGRSDELLRALHGELIARHGAGRQVVLLAEEAQAMPLATLEQLRLLTNLETAHHKLLQIVLFGQPELDAQLALPHMRQLRERITHSFTVPALTPALVPDYLAHRLRAAGHQGPPLFSAAAARLIGRAAQGTVRRVTILADQALLAAYADDAARVELRHALRAIRQAPFRAAGTGRRRLAQALWALIAVLLAALAWIVLHPPGTGNYLP